MTTKGSKGAILCQGLTVAFIYTFSLSVWVPEEEANNERHWFEFPDTLRAGLVQDLQAEYNERHYTVHAGTPTCRKGVLPFFTLDDRRKTIYFLSPEYKGVLHGFLGKQNVSITICTRLSNTGVGTCCIAVELVKPGEGKSQKPIDLRKIADFFNLTKNTWGDFDVNKLSLDGERKKTSVFQLFQREVTTLTKAFENIKFRAKWVERDVPIALPNGERPFINPELFKSEQAVTPYLITILEFTDHVYKEIFLHTHSCKHETSADNPVHLAHKELANILFAIIRPNWGWDDDCIRSEPDLNYVDAFFRSHNGILTNLNMMAIPFISIGYRSCLIACVDKKGESSQVMIPSTFDCVEILRVQWHFYILANTILDDETENLIKRRPSTTELSQFIKLREKLALVLENLETFRWGGNALATIFNEGESLFELRELRSTVLKKLELLGILYDDIRELDRQKQYAKFSEKLEY